MYGHLESPEEIMLSSVQVGRLANELISSGFGRADAIEEAFDELLRRDGRFVRTGEVLCGPTTASAVCVNAT